MKRLILIRHAKSSWAVPNQSDFERVLNDRGIKDAPMMGKRLKEAGILPDKIIASTAKRAAQTASFIAGEVNYPVEKIDWCGELYHCIPSVFETILLDVDDHINTLFIVAHNPGISEFATQLSSYSQISHMPTCAIAGFEFETERWSEIFLTDKRLFLFDTPRKPHE